MNIKQNNIIVVNQKSQAPGGQREVLKKAKCLQYQIQITQI